MSDPKAYPLQWPKGWPETEPKSREAAKFKQTLPSALHNLKRQIQMMGGSGVNLHTALFWPEWGVQVWGLLAARRWDEAQAEINRMLLPYYELSGAIGAYTGGEGHIDKLGLELVGLPGGRNRPPTRPLPPSFKQRLRQLCLEVGMPLDV